MDHYKAFISLITNVCEKKKLQVNHKRINNGSKFYYVTINDKKFEKTVAFSAGIHGNEPAGPFAVLKFLTEYESSNPDVRIILLPCVNPYGFDGQVRFNAFRQDINRRFCDKLLSGEAKAIYDVLKKSNIDYLVTLHEWDGLDGFYMYASDSIKKDVISKMPSFASDGGLKVLNGQKINGEEVKDGIIWHPLEGYKEPKSRCTLENRLYVDGVHYICTETPSRNELSQRVNVQTNLMHFIIDKLV